MRIAHFGLFICQSAKNDIDFSVEIVLFGRIILGIL
jgi:hypothetical protein